MCAANENSDTRLPAITTGSGLFGRRDWARLGSARWWSADSRRISVRAFPRGEGLHPRRRQPRSRAPITIAPVRHSRRTAFAVRPRLTTT